MTRRSLNHAHPGFVLAYEACVNSSLLHSIKHIKHIKQIHSSIASARSQWESLRVSSLPALSTQLAPSSNFICVYSQPHHPNNTAFQLAARCPSLVSTVECHGSFGMSWLFSTCRSMNSTQPWQRIFTGCNGSYNYIEWSLAGVDNFCRVFALQTVCLAWSFFILKKRLPSLPL